jgi:hypothetical protein
LAADHVCLRDVEAMLREVKADVAALRSEVGQVRKAADAQEPTRPQGAPSAAQLDWLIVSSFPPFFDEFRGKRFMLLWRGSCDDFGFRDFHGRCNGQANTLRLILETGEMDLGLHAAAM